MPTSRRFRRLLGRLVPSVLAVGLAVALSGQSASAQDGALPWMDESLSPQERTALLIPAMTLDQKIQQIYIEPGANQELEDDGCEPQRVGRQITGIPALDIPTFRMANGGTGLRGGACLPEPTATAVPSGVMGGATFDASVNRAWGRVLGTEIRAWAHQVLLGPAINLIRHPYGGRMHEYFSEDPYLTGVLGSQQVRGIQEDRVTQAQIKHFVANEEETERWTMASRVPSQALHELYLLPFEMVVKDANVASVMCAFPHLNYDWACENRALLVQTLREDWGFDGWVMSDRRATHSTVASILAGNDVELDFTAEHYTPELIKAAIAAGEITEADIDALLRPRYTKMFEYGQFDTPYDRFLPVDLDADGQVAKRAAQEGIVLLKNESGALPLRATGARSVALIGMRWFAGQATLPPRNIQPDRLEGVVAANPVSPEQGLRNTLRELESNARVTYDDGRDIDAAAELAADSDIAIVMVGDNPRETRDKTSLELPTLAGTNQEELVPALLRANPNTVVVIKTSGMILMPWLRDARALIEAWYPGQEDGNVVADTLFGVIPPAGKLPVTFGNTAREAAYAADAQYPGLREDNGLGGPTTESVGDPQLVASYTEGMEMGYRWYEANKVRPLFPFGFGLSYTTFEYSDLSLDVRRSGDRTVANVSYTITNTGNRFGREASQVYLRLPRSAGEPFKRLVGFDKVGLPAGGSERVTVPIDSAATNHPMSYFDPEFPDDLRLWAEGSWVTPEGDYTVRVGTSSERTPLQGSFVVLPPAPAPPTAPPSGGGTGGSGGTPGTPDAGAGRPEARPGKVSISGQRLRANRKRIVKVRVHCPSSSETNSNCQGALTAWRGRADDRRRVGRTPISIPAGRTATVKLRLNRKAFDTLVRKRAMSLRLRVRVRVDGDLQQASRWVWVVAPHRPNE